MLPKESKELLKQFADQSDKLLTLGVISTDSFIGEIGEYFVCQHYKLDKAARVTAHFDGTCPKGKKYQVKAKVGNAKSTYVARYLDYTKFDYLVIIFLSDKLLPIKIVRIPSRFAENIRISASGTYSRFQVIPSSSINIPSKQKKAIMEFASTFNLLKQKRIVRSKRIVGDIGEYYAAKKLRLTLAEKLTEKGIDAYHPSGLTFEIKTRRVYESERRISNTRRLNGLVGKSADYLIVVILDREFDCAGMWVMPMKNITNPLSANLRVVNNTVGCMNVVPSKVEWLKTGPKFQSFAFEEKLIATRVPSKTTFIKRGSNITMSFRKVLAQIPDSIEADDEEILVVTKPTNETPILQFVKDLWSFSTSCIGVIIWSLILTILAFTCN